jgi:hypothetical protein
MGEYSVVRKIAVTGSLMGMVWASGLWAEDPVLQMVPGDCLFCVRINNLDQTLGQLDQFLLGASPINVGVMVKMKLGQILGNPMLTGVKTDGTFAILAVVPAGEIKDPEVILNGLSILLPISDYGQFTSSSPKIGKPDPNGVSELEGVRLRVTNLGNWALLGPSPGGIAAMAKSLKAGAAKPLAGALDPGEVTAATQSPLWIYGNVQVLAKALGPGISDKIKQAGEKFSKAQPGAAQGMDMKGLFSMYANLADTLLKETRSVAVTVTPKPNVLVVGTTVAALPGTSMANMLTKTSTSKKEWKFLNYLEDGAMTNMAFSGDFSFLVRYNQWVLNFFPAAGGQPGSDAQTKQINALYEELAKVMGTEMGSTFAINGHAKPIFSAKTVCEVKDGSQLGKLADKGVDLLNGPGSISDLYASMGMKLAGTVKHATDTYQGATIDTARFTITTKDPNSPQAQMIQKMYGDSIEIQWAIMDGRWVVVAVGADAKADLHKLIDQVKVGGPKQVGNEFKAALDILPEAKNADMVMTLNYPRMFSAMIPAMMPVPMPQVNFQTKSNLVLAGTVDKGKGILQVALPKEHLTEIVQGFQMIAMQQQQKAGAPGRKVSETEADKAALPAR